MVVTVRWRLLISQVSFGSLSFGVVLVGHECARMRSIRPTRSAVAHEIRGLSAAPNVRGSDPGRQTAGSRGGVDITLHSSLVIFPLECDGTEQYQLLIIAVQFCSHTLFLLAPVT